MLAIVNAELVLRDHFLPDAYLLIDNGMIVDFGEMKDIPTLEGCERIDAEGLYLAPGLVDIHSHTGGEYQAWQNPAEAAKFHLTHGVTTYLPATYGRMTREQYVEACNRVKAVMGTPEGESIGGMYLEGPYTNPKFGSNRSLNPWDKPISEDDYLPILEAAKEVARVIALAPERENILQFVKAAKSAIPNLRFTVGHSEAIPDQIEALMPYGLSIATHHTNATGTILKYPECRSACVDETVNYNREIYAEIISDSKGIHVEPYMQRLIRKIKGIDRIILVSDRTYGDAPNPPGFEGITDLNFDKEGEIAGSRLTLEVAAGNFMKHTGSSLVDAFSVASYNPSRALGFYDRGEIAVGKRADLVITDHKMNISKVILNGKIR